MCYSAGRVAYGSTQTMTKRRKLTPEEEAIRRQKISDALKGRKAWNKGMKLVGRPHSEESRKKMSESAKKAWANASKKRRIPWNKGLTGDDVLTPEGRKRKQEACRKQWKGVPKSEEQKHKMSESQKGREVPDEQRRKIAKTLRKHFKENDVWNKGVPCRPETKKKLSEALEGRPGNSGTFRKGHVPANKGKELPHMRGKNNPSWKGGITPENLKIRTSAKFLNWRKQVFERDDYTCQICRIRGGALHAHHILQFSIYPALRFEVDNGLTLCEKDHRMIHGIARTKVELET